MEKVRKHFVSFVDGFARSIDVAGSLHTDSRRHQELRNIKAADALRSDLERVGADFRRATLSASHAR